MCDDFFDDFGDDYECEPEDYGDDGFEDSKSGEDGDSSSESDDVTWPGLDWQDWMIIGPLSEEIAREKRERDRIRRESEEDGDYWASSIVNGEQSLRKTATKSGATM